MKQTILKLYSDLYYNHHESGNTQWQSIDIDKRNPIVEVLDTFVKFKYDPDLTGNLNPDLPWAEDHFLERINGEPINPGSEYKNWPYYKNGDNDDLFRSTGKFSHNYMERYWCSDVKGRRYQYGDLLDIMDRIKDNPFTRQAYLAVWHPEDQSNNNVRVPCTLGYWFYFNGKTLDITYHIRSCDAARHLRNDVYMTLRLLEYVCEYTNLKPGTLKMWIGSLHCFKSDLYTLRKYVRDSDNS
jgi:thymidylate synthase